MPKVKSEVKSKVKSKVKSEVKSKVKTKVKSKGKSNPKKAQAKKRRCDYNKENLRSAVHEVLDGKSVAEVSRKYNVPESTIRARKQGKYADKPPGPVTTLSAQEESELVEWIFHCSRRGFPVTKHQLVESVKLICDNDKRKTPFVDNKPGRGWFEGFLKRHPNISQRISENVSLNRAKVSEYRIRSWFTEVTDCLPDFNLRSIHPSRVFNADETGVPMNPKPPAVLAPKGSKNVYNIVNNNEKENITVLITANAAGDLAPPLVLFAGQSVPKDVTALGPPNYSFGFSDNGWMTARNFFEYIANVFHPWLLRMGIEFPIILYIDGHASHITLPLSQFCRANKIVLIALCPNATHILQPLDVSFFRPFKLAWQKAFKSFCQSFGTMSIKKSQFALVLQRTFEVLNLDEILRNGFKTCGLHPWDVDAIDFEKVFKRLETESSETTNDTDHPAKVSDKGDALKILEDLIGKDKLESFIRHRSPTWTGQREDESLFKIWYKLAVPTNATNADRQMETRIASMENDGSFDLAVEVTAGLSNTEYDSANKVGSIETDSPVADNRQDVTDREQVVLELFFDTDGSVLTTEMRDLPDELLISSLSTPENIDEELESQEAEVPVFLRNPPISALSPKRVHEELKSQDTEVPVCLRSPPNSSLTPENIDEELKSQKAEVPVCLENPPFSALSPERVDEELKGPETAVQIAKTAATAEVLDTQTTSPSDDPVISKFSEPFQRILFWPKDELTKKNKRRTIAKKMPSVLSSSQWQSIKETEENEKRSKAEQIAIKKKMKIEKQELTKKEKEEERERREAEKLKKEQIKFEKEKEKLKKQQERIKEIAAKQKAKEKSLLRKKEAVEIKKKIEELRESLNCGTDDCV